MTNLMQKFINVRKCLAWLVVIDYCLIGFYVYLVTSLLYVDVFIIGILLALYNILLVTFVVHQPAGFLSFERDKHLVIPICFATFLGCSIVVLTLFW
ncbi:hypothetical protein MD535_00955 [Vibrio sp. ZSDZ65]|uniref:Uncharacterized protein n=1 Tax=Vibrio qingdaonensis TaxID=2829491 RepID=A0A9X3CJM0_9VIBR|nr:hypothetical protein [Vibrio qingdaonensis]MCW8344597.1 hypothetical protein [Vibrio qingdaonensis]